MDRLLSMRVFEKVIDEGGFASAARALNMSPAVVTRLVADLESHLGTRLLHRTTRRLALSDAGEAYLGKVRAILQDIDEAHDIASSRTHELRGVLRILTPPVLATHIVAPLIANFRQKYPKITIHMEVSYFKQPPIEDFDVTLMATDAGFDGNVIARKISAADAILVASPGYILRKGAPTHPQDLSSHEVLSLQLPGSVPGQWHLINPENTDEAMDVPITPGLVVNHTDTLLRAALDGAGITTTAVDLVAPYLTRGELVRVLRPWIAGRLSLYAAIPSRKYLPERTRVFLDYLAEMTKQENKLAMQACEGAMGNERIISPAGQTCSSTSG